MQFVVCQCNWRDTCSISLLSATNFTCAIMSTERFRKRALQTPHPQKTFQLEAVPFSIVSQPHGATNPAAGASAEPPFSFLGQAPPPLKFISSGSKEPASLLSPLSHWYSSYSLLLREGPSVIMNDLEVQAYKSPPCLVTNVLPV